MNASSGVRLGSQGTGTVNQSGGTFNAAVGRHQHRAFRGRVGTYNLNGGTLLTLNIASTIGINAVFNFNGGTLKAAANNTAFFHGLSGAYVRDGGAVIDTTNFNITIDQPLLQSTNIADVGTGGLTKLGAGIVEPDRCEYLHQHDSGQRGHVVGYASASGDRSGHSCQQCSIRSAGQRLWRGHCGQPDARQPESGHDHPGFFSGYRQQSYQSRVAGRDNYAQWHQHGSSVRNRRPRHIPDCEIHWCNRWIGNFQHKCYRSAWADSCVVKSYVAGSTLYVTVTGSSSGTVWTGMNSAPALINGSDLNSAINCWLEGCRVLSGNHSAWRRSRVQ